MNLLAYYPGGNGWADETPKRAATAIDMVRLPSNTNAVRCDALSDPKRSRHT